MAGNQSEEVNRPDNRCWHAESADDVLDAVGSGTEGLAPEEAKDRLSQHGPNRLPDVVGRSTIKRFLAQFNNLLIYVLLVAAGLSFAFDHIIDAVVILAVVMVNTTIGFVQEGRAEDALKAIRNMIDPKAAVVRGGQRVTIPADEIVPGDIVLIESGDRVPADIRLIRARNLKIEEAALTGESVPADKGESAVLRDAVLGDRSSLAYSGTFVTSGQASGVVVGTGADTELGRISTLIGTVETLQTPLVVQMNSFTRVLTGIILGLAVIAFLFANLLRDYGLEQAFMILIGLGVAGIPEGLPAILTVTLAIGVQRMARRNAIIRRLPAVETLGAISVICSDKTGTLTRNEMTARTLLLSNGTWDITGTGYGPDGSFQKDDKETDPETDAALMELVQAGLLCNDANVRQKDRQWKVDGDPMEGALVTLAMKAGLDPTLVRKQIPRNDEIPFDSRHRFMATLHHSHEGREDAPAPFILIKGAPEAIIKMCDTERDANGDIPIDREKWHQAGDDLAARGQRLLAFAMKPAPNTQALSFDDVDGSGVLLGLIGFIDPPREEAIEAVKDCRSAGIRTIMITGDHVATAREIARQLGLADDPKALTGKDLDSMDDAALREAAQDVTVFARTTPEHKLSLVKALQDDGFTVAMTGDGVNDAPALKRADIGVAMGGKGTEAAKEASEMVLADDNFASIVAAIREGRTVYDNLRKSISFLLPINGGESLSLLVAVMLGVALPIEPLQILWVNMVSSVALAAALAFEPTEPGVMSRPPRNPREPLLSGFVVWRVCFVSALFLIGIFGMFNHVISTGGSVELARTVAINTLVVMEIFYLFSVRYVHGTSLSWKGVLGTRVVLIGVTIATAAQFLVTYAPFMQTVFNTRPVPLELGLMIVGVGILLLMVMEMEKLIRRRIWPETKPAQRLSNVAVGD